MMMVSYIPKKSKSVVLLSSSHPNKRIAKETNASQKRDRKKPEMILEYNKTKYGFDKFDEITKSTCIRATSRWTMNVLYNILDMTCYNSYIAYKTGMDEKLKRKKFLKELSATLHPKR